MEMQNNESVGNEAVKAEMGHGQEVKKKENDLAKVFAETSNELKIVMLGGVLAFLGCFLPWWSISSTGTYAVTSTINAFSGATFFLGFIVFLGAIFSMVVIFSKLSGKKVPFFKEMAHAVVQMLVGGAMTVLMLVALSIFTSPSFSAGSVTGSISSGVSYGTFIVALGAVMILMGGWLEWKGKKFLRDQLKPEKKMGEVKVDLNDDLKVRHEESKIGVDIEKLQL